ncbi:MAG: 30S ribosomal protein S8 [Planctomycetes bacterium]|nr:30S ribosomal protein S8 [Planctomycetota bacterium]MBI3836020.1 30S ribosomal protein S8 [Planctomycetota bacterium]
MWADTIADMLTRIRNGVRVRQKQVVMPFSKQKAGIAEVLREEGYINGYDKVDDNKQGLLRVDLKYGPRGEEIVHMIRRESHTGCRVYKGVEELPRVLDGLGICIVSTNKGMLSDRRCRELNVGGELICTVY